MIIRRFTLRIGAVLLLLSLAANGFAQPIQGKYIVQVKAGASPAAVAARHGLAPDCVYGAAVNGFAGTIPPGKLRALRSDSRVESIVQDNAVYAYGKPGSGGGTSTGEVIPEGVKRIGAPVAGFTGFDVGVAVIDTGVDLHHADLSPVLDAFSA